jgi:SAM-dependent methyltransferase
MSHASFPPDQYETDRDITVRNREGLTTNHNLLLWYEELYRHQFQSYPDPDSLSILEVGSGVSPLQRFIPNVITSDVLALDYIDHIFDCHTIDQFDAIPSESLDVITMTNVLHHLKAPIDFLERAASKLKPGGQVIATEPYFSTLAAFIYRRLHHEPVDLEISAPILREVRGPLASANIALPWLIFVKNSQWSERLRTSYDFDAESFEPFSAVSYMATGGISRRLPIPSFIYRRFLRLDLAISRMFPMYLASFFTIILRRR